MEEKEAVRNPPRWGRRGLLGFVVIIGLVVAWHLYLSIGINNFARSVQSTSSDSEQELSISVNPLTNLVSMKLTMPPDLDKDNPFAAFGLALGNAMIQAIGPGFIEREMNTKAREQYDLYAVLVPYRVRISTEPASAEAVARMREQREKRRADEARAKAEAEAERLRSIRAYVSSNLSLEGVRVASGERFGRTVDGIFGTIENNGTRSLRKVTIRIYFLDNMGRRIGEKDFSPVLVTQFSIGDNTPLRPGYRKDFGYNVEDDAPSGWAKRVEAEIVDIEFLEQGGADEARAKVEADAERLQPIRAYVSSNLSLEHIRVAAGERFGRKIDGVFGTIVNNGPRSLDRVMIRVYFLNSAGRRIGEKDFSPVLVTKFSLGDNDPLRSGYRKDFGYSVEDDAPSGWAKRVEADIVDIKFSEN
jgi:hypothetical protein